MSLVALTRAVSRSLGRCELTFVERRPIDIRAAETQHDEYVQALRRHGLMVLRLTAEHDLADATFVEDALLVLDDIAVALVSGAPSRRAEVDSLLPVIARFRPVERLRLPGTVDGGDVVRIDRTLFIGLSTRTNAEGVRQLGEVVAYHGYSLQPVPVRGCLHLKSGCTFLGDRVLINPAYVDPAPFGRWRPLCVPRAEPTAADVLGLPDAVIMPSGQPQTLALLEANGYRVESIDISELQKAEAGVTCLSVIFEAASVPPELAALAR